MAVNRIRTATAVPPKNQSADWKSKVFRFVLKTILYFLVISVIWVTVLKFVPVWFTPYMMVRKVEALFDGRKSKIYSNWTPIEDMSKEAPLSVVASEDQLFPQHWGFDV